ncbi:MAG: cytochrome c peroxidase [Planctomycetota bacterium]|jgi:cytochrome c peroxidase
MTSLNDSNRIRKANLFVVVRLPTVQVLKLTAGGFCSSLLLLLLFGACSAYPETVEAEELESRDVSGEWDVETQRRVLQHSPLAAPPLSPTNRVADDELAAELGQFLFYETRLSANGKVSCSTCHDPDQSFADGRALAVGLEIGRRHSPSLWNVAYNRWFFWDGRADTLWTQALLPLESAAEHGTDRFAIARLIQSDVELFDAYARVFGEVPMLDDQQSVDRIFTNVGKAIEAYERLLISRSSRFDLFVSKLRQGGGGSSELLTQSERRGLELFVGKANCRLCHSGPLFSDREFHDTRVPLLDRDRAPDSGRYGGIAALLSAEFRGDGEYGDDPGVSLPNPSRRGETWGEFKTPTLRNVAMTAPYMHQGQLKTLREVVRFYSTLENARPPHDHGETTMIPLELTSAEIDDLVAFLETLTDEAIDPNLLKAPTQPLTRR